MLLLPFAVHKGAGKLNKLQSSVVSQRNTIGLNWSIFQTKLTGMDLLSMKESCILLEEKEMAWYQMRLRSSI